MSTVDLYLGFTKLMLAERQLPDYTDEDEDWFTNQLDDLWYQMTEDEKDLARAKIPSIVTGWKVD